MTWVAQPVDERHADKRAEFHTWEECVRYIGMPPWPLDKYDPVMVRVEQIA